MPGKRKSSSTQWSRPRLVPKISQGILQVGTTRIVWFFRIDQQQTECIRINYSYEVGIHLQPSFYRHTTYYWAKVSLATFRIVSIWYSDFGLSKCHKYGIYTLRCPIRDLSFRVISSWYITNSSGNCIRPVWFWDWDRNIFLHQRLTLTLTFEVISKYS